MRSFTPSELAINTMHIARDLPAFTVRPFAPAKLVQAYQLRKVRELVAFAARFVPLYRDKYRAAGVRPSDLRSLADLEHFPTVTKAEIVAAYPEGVLAPGLDMRGCLVSKSSGSTGVVLDVVHRADRLAIQGLAMHRLLGLYTRYLPWHRFAYIYTSEYPARSLLGTYPMTFIPTLAPLDEIVGTLRRVRPHLLACYPSHLRALARELGTRACREMGLRAISVSSEPSTQRERDELGAMFGCGVYDEYSTEELTRVAAQCTSATYHLFEDVAYVEVLDPESEKPVVSGARGEIVGTYLHNFAMPFIRYRQGDLGRVVRKQCSCRRTFRALEDLGGRKLDQFVLPSGRVLTSGFLLDATYSFLFDVGADIAAFTLVQETAAHVRIEIVPGKRFSSADAEAIAAHFRMLVAEPVDVVVELRAELPRTAAGKHNPIVSHVHRAMVRKHGADKPDEGS